VTRISSVARVCQRLLGFLVHFPFDFAGHRYNSAAATAQPVIIPISALVCPKLCIAVFSGGCEPPILGKGRPYGVGDGTITKSFGEFL